MTGNTLLDEIEMKELLVSRYSIDMNSRNTEETIDSGMTPRLEAITSSFIQSADVLRSAADDLAFEFSSSLVSRGDQAEAAPVEARFATAQADTNVFQGTNAADSFTGDEDRDVVHAGGGDDIISGQGGDDMIYGEGGDDFLLGDHGNDMMSGGDGNDSVMGGIGNDIIFGDAGNDRISGDGGNDSLYGGSGDDEIFGGDGADFLNGNSGNDSLFGGKGNDVLYGNSGNDEISGGEGNDSLHSGDGNDLLTGGAGNDTFVFVDTGVAYETTITDFTSGEDVIDLAAYGWEDASDDQYSMTDTDDGLLLNLENGSTILLEGVTTSEITSGDIIF